MFKAIPLRDQLRAQLRLEMFNIFKRVNLAQPGSRVGGGLGCIGDICAVVTAAHSNNRPERFTAFAVNLGSPGRASAGAVDIVVNRWSTDSERDRLLAVLMEKGPDRLLDALQDTPRAEYIRTPNSIGHDLRFARRTPGADGGERIVLVTDRRIRFWEAFHGSRSIDYPFTVIELRVASSGEGEGKGAPGPWLAVAVIQAALCRCGREGGLEATALVDSSPRLAACASAVPEDLVHGAVRQ